MPEIITKGAIMRKLDWVMNDPVARRTFSNNLNNALPGPDGFVNAGDNVNAAYWTNMLSPGEKDHFRNDWFTPLERDGWWCIDENVVEETLRAALKTLIAKADEFPTKRVDCYWTCAYQHDHTCHVSKDAPLTEKEKAKQREDKMRECAALMTKIEEGALHCREGLDRVECSILRSPVQLTFIVHTPPPPNGYAPLKGMTYPDPIQVVKWDYATNAPTVVIPTWQPYAYGP